MGWKCHCLFVGDIESGYFGTKPTHSPEKARVILQTLRLAPDRQGTKSGAEVYPRDGIVIGAFDKGAFIATAQISDDLEKRENRFFRRAMECYPEANLLALGLHSVVDFAAFSYYTNGQQVRTFACAEGGIIHQSGERLPEEESEYENSIERDGKIFFPRELLPGEVHEFDISGIGEEIVFNLGARPLGRSLEEIEADLFETEFFALKESSDSSSRVKSKEKAQAKPFWKFW